MAVAAGSPRPFSFRAPVVLVPAQPEQALRLLAGRQVDHRHPALSLFHLALRLRLHLEVAWSEVYSLWVARALLRLAVHLDLHPAAADQAGRSQAVLAVRRRAALPHRGQL